MTDIQYLHSSARASQAVIVGQYVETAGLVARCLDQGIKQQTECVLAQLDQLLKEIGSTNQQIIKVQIWLANMNDFDEMNQVYDAWMSNLNKPARACVGAQLASPDYLIEIQAKAVLH